MARRDDAARLRVRVRKLGLDLIRGDGRYQNRYAIVQKGEPSGRQYLTNFLTIKALSEWLAADETRLDPISPQRH